MSVLKTNKQVQEELDSKYGKGLFEVIEYKGRKKQCIVKMVGCGCEVSHAYINMLKQDSRFCEHHRMKTKEEQLQSIYPDYSINCSRSKNGEMPMVRIEGVKEGMNFDVIRRYTKNLLEGCLTITKKELGVEGIKKRKTNKTIGEVKEHYKQEYQKECTVLHPHNDYTDIIYNGNKGKVKKIRCIEHDEYFDVSSARGHKKGKGVYCPKCKEQRELERLEAKRQEYIELFNKKHNGKYGDYSDFVYLGCQKNSTFTCPDHGQFKQTPISHATRTFGCQKCGAEASNGYGRSAYIKRCDGRESELYLIRIYNEHEEFYKVGITVDGIKNRFKRRNRLKSYSFELIKIIKGEAGEIWDLENKVHTDLRNSVYNYIPKELFHGYTECYSQISPLLKYFEHLRK